MGLVWAALSLLPAPLARADEPPVADRPDNFSGAVGVYQISMTAAPTELRVEDPLTLTVRVTGSGPDKNYLPRRDRLRLFSPQFDELFYREDLPEQDRVLPAEQAWEFRYQLKPRGVQVTKVPRLAFVYYHPTERSYKTTYSSTVKLTVKPRTPAVEVGGTPQPLSPTEQLYQLTEGPAVLRRERTFASPGPLGLAALLLTPPVLCVVWYQVWRRRYPDAARLAWQRRSRAARLALKALRAAGPDPTGERASAVVADYLRQRFDVPAREPTPAEASAGVEHRGMPTALAEQVAAFLRSCDFARFAPEPPSGPADLAADARRLILALESEPCLSAS
jgi:hypothetical protein